jgi:iron complex transport system permease protein
MTRILVAVGIAAAVLLVAPFIGPPLAPDVRAFVLWQLRVPRTLAGALVGSMLALAGATFQAVFANPLATPSTVGTVAGATLGVLAAVVAVPDAASVTAVPVLALTAFAGAMAASFTVLAVASAPRVQMHHVLLAGIAATLAANAVSTALQSVADTRQIFTVAQWSLGHLAQVGYDGAVAVAPVVVVCQLLLLRMTPALQALALDEQLAHAQGVDVRRVRRRAIAVSALGVAFCVAWCGPIAFVGLLVPHLVRLIVGPAQRRVMPLSAVTGAAFLVACDVAGRSLPGGREIPVGVVTAALGAIGLLLLVIRAAR